MKAESTAPTLDIDVLRRWIGKSETVGDMLDAGPARRMQATLDRNPDFGEGCALPLFWHYLYFNPEVPASRLQRDGHEILGRFLPPVALPRRMWAGGRLTIERPLVCGEHCLKTSTIRDVTMKEGRSGPLCFVSVDNVYSVDGARRVAEQQTIVYRSLPAPDDVPPPARAAPRHADVERIVSPDPIMLFRYSALIFFGHRIHYDVDYARDVEGYPGLVVHGPLVAALLCELGRNERPGQCPRCVDVRPLSPLFGTDSFTIAARREEDVVRTWARAPDGSLAMTVDLHFAADTGAPDMPAA